MKEQRLAAHWPATHQRRNLLSTRQVRLLFGRVTVTGSGCWQWTGGKTTDGYGSIRLSQRTHRVHRLVWRLLVHELRRSIMLDHLCRNHACCNPDHLQPVTKAENDRRGKLAKQVACRRAGHPLSGDNLYRHPTTGRRICRACRRERQAA